MPTTTYDEDANMLATASDLDTDSESDSEHPNLSAKSKDKDVLDDDYEGDRFLSAMSSRFKVRAPVADRFSDNTFNHGQKSQIKRRQQRRRRSSTANEEASSLMYEMEEGFKESSSNSSLDSLILDRKQWQTQPTGSKKRYCLYVMLISIFIAALFTVLAYGAYHASQFPHYYTPKALSNGTHMFKPTTILISLDGFRADFLQRGFTPSLNAFVQSGISPNYMLPSFPSVTFPNHYTLVTGLYPESHGIVSNQFWDPEFQEEFYYTNTTISMQPKWWSAAEPLWVTAEKQGVKTAIHMWPGSEAHILGVEPTYLDAFNAHEQLPRKVDRAMELLDKKDEERPQLLALYVPDVDAAGHKFGPNSTEIRASIANADNMMTLLIEGLLQRNLTEIVNLVVVSDHGMATMSVHRMVQLDDLIDLSPVDHIDGWPLRGLRLKNPERDLATLHEQLLKAAKKAGTFDVYTLDTMPERYHFSNNPRIAPLWVIPRTGWLVIERESFDIDKALREGREFQPRGIHGFDHEHPLMRAIFVARGPAFPHKPNSRVATFQNIEVYNIVCDSLGVVPHQNNGTIRLPMVPEGLHDDPNSQKPELPTDDPAEIGDSSPFGSEDDSDAPNAEPGEEVTSDSDEKEAKSSWWKYIHDQLQKAKDWAKEIIDSISNNKADSP